MERTPSLCEEVFLLGKPLNKWISDSKERQGAHPDSHTNGKFEVAGPAPAQPAGPPQQRQSPPPASAGAADHANEIPSPPFTASGGGAEMPSLLFSRQTAMKDTEGVGRQPPGHRHGRGPAGRWPCCAGTSMGRTCAGSHRDRVSGPSSIVATAPRKTLRGYCGTCRRWQGAGPSTSCSTPPSGRAWGQAKRAKAEDVAKRWRLLIDIDADRPDPTRTDATAAEKAAAEALAIKLKLALTADGWPAPVTIDSGNGYYQVYWLDLLNDEGIGAETRIIKVFCCSAQGAVRQLSRLLHSTSPATTRRRLPSSPAPGRKKGPGTDGSSPSPLGRIHRCPPNRPQHCPPGIAPAPPAWLEMSRSSCRPGRSKEY